MGSQFDPVDEKERQEQRSVLPDWMRDPPPPRMTIGRRVSSALAKVRWLTRLRRRWWAFKARRRISDRFPTTTKIITFFLAWGASVGLIMLAYGCFGSTQQ
jgi:hypothetical protein